VEKLLRALMGDLPRKGEHSDGVLIGDEGGGILERRWGLAPPETLKGAVEELLAAARARRRGAGLAPPGTSVRSVQSRRGARYTRRERFKSGS
jgi:hypothetical protein